MQPMAVIAELMAAEELVRVHPEFQAALARRGITDFEAVQVDAWPAGHFGAGRGRRAGGSGAAWRSSSRTRATASGRARSTA